MADNHWFQKSREVLGASREALARELGTTPEQIEAMERGEIQVPRVIQLAMHTLLLVNEPFKCPTCGTITGAGHEPLR